MSRSGPQEQERAPETRGELWSLHLFTSLQKAGRQALSRLSRVSPGLAPAIQKGLTRGWYQGISAMNRNVGVIFMNYGYVPLEGSPAMLVLDAEEERDRYGAQLYHRVAGAIDLRDRDVLEVGCGRGAEQRSS